MSLASEIRAVRQFGQSSKVSDNSYLSLYSAMMAGGAAHIVVTLDTREPIEIGNFVAVFTSLSNQYTKFISENYPDLAPDAKIFVRDIEKGSIIAELIPFMQMMGIPAAIPVAKQLDAVIDFVQKYGGRIAGFIAGTSDASASASDLKDFYGTVEAIATDPNGSSSIQAAHFEDGKREVRAAITFNTQQAREAVKNIEAEQRLLQSRGHEPRPRVLMVFTQSNIKTSPVEKRTGERVIIEDISPHDLPLVYASDLAEEQIKHEIREADENVFKKGFVVDVSIQTKNGKPVAYRVVNLHQVIDLPDDL